MELTQNFLIIIRTNYYHSQNLQAINIILCKSVSISEKSSVCSTSFSIPTRPSIRDNDERDWEMDTIVGKDGKGAIVTLTERSTNMILMERLTHVVTCVPCINIF